MQRNDLDRRRIMIMAGEPSGDLYGALLARALRDLAPEADLFGIGGDRMDRAGVSLQYRVEKLAFMGVVEVGRHLRMLRQVLTDMRRALRDRRPDVLVLIDYPGFNLLLAEAARRYGIPSVYYIPPKVWAWGKWRIGRMRQSISSVVCILPFELSMYRKHGLNAKFVGHPLLEIIGPGVPRETFRAHWGIRPDARLIGLLPGSRRQEVERLLPGMLQAVREASRMPGGLEVLVSRAEAVDASVYDRIFDEFGEYPGVVAGEAYDLMRHSDLLLVTSGTATLEAAILGTPMIILYRMARASYGLARCMVRVPCIGLPNLILGRKVVPELIQREARPTRIAEVMRDMWSTGDTLSRMRGELARVRERLGETGASRRAARAILDTAGFCGEKMRESEKNP